MSDSIEKAAEQAYATVVEQLAAPYFFNKLAAAGHAPQTEKEAEEMWAVAEKLHVLYTAEQEKTAAARYSDLAAVNQRLGAVLAGGEPAAVEKQAVFSGYAAAAAEKPEIANAILTLQAAAAAAAQTE
jgi:hypothetical protein